MHCSGGALEIELGAKECREELLRRCASRRGSYEFTGSLGQDLLGKAPNAVSWYRNHLEASLALIEQISPRSSSIIDVGGGESTLVDDLLAHGHEDCHGP